MDKNNRILKSEDIFLKKFAENFERQTGEELRKASKGESRKLNYGQGSVTVRCKRIGTLQLWSPCTHQGKTKQWH